MRRGVERGFCPGYPATEIDPVGAGDAFCAGLLSGSMANPLSVAAQRKKVGNNGARPSRLRCAGNEGPQSQDKCHFACGGVRGSGALGLGSPVLLSLKTQTGVMI